MKANIDKRAVMTRAWKIYRGKNAWSSNFSLSLRRAWEVEKMNAAYDREMAEREAIRAERANRPYYNVSASSHFMAGCTDYYNNAPRGTYFGD